MLERIFGALRRPRMRCAVVTPIGPGHRETYRETEASVKAAWRANRGPFSGLDILAIDDTAGAKGRSNARNEGVRQADASGADWTFFLDADDLMLPEAFANVADLVDSYDAVWGLIASRGIDAPEHHLRLPQILAIERIESLLVFDPFLTLQMGHFVRTEVALATPFAAEMNAGEDFDYYLRLWQRYRCIKVPKSFFVARQGRRSEGPRGASAEAWGTAVRSRLMRERVARGLDTESDQVLAIKNAAVADLQTFYRERGLADASNYLALSREMPYRGFHQIDRYAGAPFRLYSDNDDTACLSLAWTGEYEHAASRLWQALAASAQRILDIGAGSGFYGLLAARAAGPNTRIVCFEPSADNVSRLHKNIEANQPVNITPIHADAAQVGVGGLIAEHGGRSDLVRIDVGGAICATISGMAQILASTHPDILTRMPVEESRLEIEQTLTATGYRVFAIDEDACSLIPFAWSDRDAQCAGMMCWATARGDADVRSIASRAGIVLDVV